MKLYGKVTGIHLGGTVDFQVETVNGGASQHSGMLTITNEGNWKLGDHCEINLTIAKTGTPQARTAAARAARAGG